MQGADLGHLRDSVPGGQSELPVSMAEMGRWVPGGDGSPAGSECSWAGCQVPRTERSPKVMVPCGLTLPWATPFGEKETMTFARLLLRLQGWAPHGRSSQQDTVSTGGY